MKNILPYLAGLLVAALIVLVIVSANRLVPDLFPAAEIYYDHNHPVYWD